MDYFIEKYGKEKGTEFYKDLNEKKRINIETFIRKYGVEEGHKRYEQLKIKRMESFQNRSKQPGTFYSKVSQTLFSELLKNINNIHHENFYYMEKNNEYGFFGPDKSLIFVDFYDIMKNKVIEFHGDFWHGNPIKYKENDFLYNIHEKKITAKDVWKKDEERINTLKNQYKCDILVVWENDFTKKQEETIKKCLNFLNYENRSFKF